MLESIVLLSEIRVDELMRPRTAIALLSIRPSPLADFAVRCRKAATSWSPSRTRRRLPRPCSLDDLWEAPETDLDR